ncbi:MAG: hypothetical protein ACP5E5_00375 [Acidobacteriaceae bacterium]
MTASDSLLVASATTEQIVARESTAARTPQSPIRNQTAMEDHSGPLR